MAFHVKIYLMKGGGNQIWIWQNWGMKFRSKRSKLTFRVAAILIAVVPFIAMEIGLRVFGGSDDQAKLTEGLQPTVPLFTRDDDSGFYKTSLPYQQFFAEVSFVPKRSGQRPDSVVADKKMLNPDKLIFVLGGSTVQGRPFAPATAFPAWAEDVLNDVCKQRIRIVNCGGVSLASDRLSRLVPELLSYDPDLIVIATGHNEFLEDHTYSRSDESGFTNAVSQLKTVAMIRRLLKPEAVRNASDDVPIANHEVKAKLDNKAGYQTYHYDAEWHADVVRRFEASLLSIVDECEAANVPVSLIELAANSRDCAPLKSEHAPTVSEADRQGWRASMDQAESAMDLMDWAAAIPLLQTCVAASPEHALTHFRLARCFRANQQFDKASRHFRLALDYDVCPLRMKSELAGAIHNVAAERSVDLIQCDGLLEPLLPNNSQDFGFELFLDHVHPTIRAHQIIGIRLAEAIQTLGIANGSEIDARARLKGLFEQRIGLQPDVYFRNGQRRIGWLENWARAQKTSEEIIPITTSDLAQRIRRQLELRDDATVSQLANVLVKAADGERWLMDLADDFLLSGQRQQVFAVLQLLSQRQLTDTNARRLKAIQNLLQSGDGQPSQQTSAVDAQQPQDTLLDTSARSLVQDILDQSGN